MPLTGKLTKTILPLKGLAQALHNNFHSNSSRILSPAEGSPRDPQFKNNPFPSYFLSPPGISFSVITKTIESPPFFRKSFFFYCSSGPGFQSIPTVLQCLPRPGTGRFRPSSVPAFFVRDQRIDRCTHTRSQGTHVQKIGKITSCPNIDRLTITTIYLAVAQVLLIVYYINPALVPIYLSI